jgi:hypothetical protein
MTYFGSLFFNFLASGEVLLIVIDNSSRPDKIVTSGDVVGLYKDKRLIGVNIFNSSDYLRLRLNGLVHNPNEPLINLINSLIKASLNENVILEPSPVLLGKVTDIADGSYKVQLEDENQFLASCLPSESSFKKGDYVLLAPKGSRLDNGDKADQYLKGEQMYLIIGSEVEGIEDDASLGSQTYSLKEDK